MFEIRDGSVLFVTVQLLTYGLVGAGGFGVLASMTWKDHEIFLTCIALGGVICGLILIVMGILYAKYAPRDTENKP